MSQSSVATSTRVARQPSSGATRRVPAVLSLCAAWLAACATGPEHFGVQVQVRGEGGTPVAGAQIRARGDYLGTTDTLGLALLQIPGIAGDRVPVTLTCSRSPPSRAQHVG